MWRLHGRQKAILEGRLRQYAHTIESDPAEATTKITAVVDVLPLSSLGVGELHCYTLIPRKRRKEKP